MERYFFSLRVSALLDRFKEKLFANKKKGKNWKEEFILNKKRGKYPKEEFIAEKLFKSFPEGPQNKSDKDILRIIELEGFKGEMEEHISISYIQYLWGTKWAKANPGIPCISDEAYLSRLRNG